VSAGVLQEAHSFIHFWDYVIVLEILYFLNLRIHLNESEKMENKASEDVDIIYSQNMNPI